MASSGVFCNDTDVALKAGVGMSSDIDSGDTAETDKWIADAESYINSITRRNWTDDYAGLNADVKYLLRECAACLAAIYAINYDMSGYTNLAEAQTMLNVNWARAMECIKLLKDKKTEDFIDGET